MDTLPSDDDLVEDAVAECLAATERAAALQAACARHPRLAERIRLALMHADRFEGIVREASTVSEAEAPPPILAHYRLEQRLGAGGMGVVYRARDGRLGREVAIKLVRPDLLHLDGARVRFRHEVEVVAKMSHPGIVPIYDVGEHANVPWYAMELVHGVALDHVVETLADRDPATLSGADLLAIVAGPQANIADSSSAWCRGTWSDVCLRVVRQVAEALQHAHDRGVLHRDIKPSNVILDRAGRARVIDFGLARVEGGERMTRTGTDVGSLAYMAPELLRGEDADRKSDVYALGVTLYELLTLRLPFRDRKREGTRAAILEGRPRMPRSANRALPWDAATICECAMDPDPARRFRTAQEFAEDIERALEHEPILARRPGLLLRAKRFGLRHPTVVALTAVLAVFAFVTPLALNVLFRSERDSARAAQRQAEWQGYLGNVAAVWYGGDTMKPSEAATRLAACSERLRAFEWQFLERRRDASLRTFPGHQVMVQSVAFTSDGKSVVTIDATGAVRVFAKDTGASTRNFLPVDSAIIGATIEPGAAHVGLLSHKGELVVADTATGETKVLAKGLAPSTVLAIPKGEPRLLMGSGATLMAYEFGAPTVVRRTDLPAMVECIDSDPVRARVATFGGGVLSLWDPPFVSPSLRHALPNVHAKALSFSTDGKRIAIMTTGGEALVIEVESGVRVFDSAFPGITCATLSDNGRRLWIAKDDGSLRGFALPAGSPLGALRGHDGRVVALAAAGGEDLLVSGSGDGSARLWRAGDQSELMVSLAEVIPGRENGGALIRMLPGDRHFLACGTAGIVKLVDAKTGAIEAMCPERLPAIALRMAIRQDGDEAVITCANGITYRFDCKSAQVIEKIAAKGPLPLAVCYLPARKGLAVGTDQGTVRVLGADGEVVAEWSVHQGRIGDLVVSADGRHLVSAGLDRKIVAIDLETRATRILGEFPVRARGLCLSSDQRRLFAASGGSIVVFDLATGNRIATWPVTKNELWHIAESPDGRRVVAGSREGTLGLLDAATGEHVLSFECQGEAVRSLAFSHDGHCLAAGTMFDTIRIWRTD